MIGLGVITLCRMGRALSNVGLTHCSYVDNFTVHLARGILYYKGMAYMPTVAIALSLVVEVILNSAVVGPGLYLITEVHTDGTCYPGYVKMW